MTVASHIKATREDWLQAAMAQLTETGADQVKILNLAARLSVSRSSFYWYFKSREELLSDLLVLWEARNPAAWIAQADAPAQNIGEAVCNVFKCAINSALFDTSLDFAVRDWARRDQAVRRTLDAADQRVVQALAAMFARFGYQDAEAITRARVLFYMQLGYNSAELNEPLERRLSAIPHYLLAFTGQEATPATITAFRAYARAVTETQA
ncbi:MAG: TetR/AcrR family transcriptional regulator [Pseudomonadota bacterium]